MWGNLHFTRRYQCFSFSFLTVHYYCPNKNDILIKQNQDVTYESHILIKIAVLLITFLLSLPLTYHSPSLLTRYDILWRYYYKEMIQFRRKCWIGFRIGSAANKNKNVIYI